MNSAKSNHITNPVLSGRLIDELTQALSGMSFGYVTLVVQDGRVIQIEKTEKIRLTKPKQDQKA